MAKITVKLFGVLRVDTHIANEEIEAGIVNDIFGILNKRIDAVYAENKKNDPKLVHPGILSFDDAIVYINGDRVPKKNKALKDGDEVWLMSPASGG